MPVFVKDYWPFDLADKPKQKRRFDYSTEDGSLDPITSIFYYRYSPEQDVLIYADYDDKGEWKDDWELIYKPGFGVAEIADWYPTKGIVKKLFGEKKVLRFSEPIGWGHFVDVGGSYANKPKVDFLRSRPPQFGSCSQHISFEDLLESFTTRHGDTFIEVLVQTYLQVWGNKATGARYWLARGVGPVALQWVGVIPEEVQFFGVDHTKINLVQSARMDAVVTNDELAS